MLGSTPLRSRRAAAARRHCADSGNGRAVDPGTSVLQYVDMLQVVAAIIEREGRILICRRTAEQSHALKWEFPGGKVEPGETADEAVRRELEEELGITEAAGQEITRYEYC